MKLKLTQQQLQALQQELTEVIAAEHIDVNDKLLVLLLTQLLIQITKMLVVYKKLHAFTMKDEHALALFVYYQNTEFCPTSYADITLKKICNDIEKKYA